MLLDKWERRWRRLIFIIIYYWKLQQCFAHYGQDLQTKRGGPKRLSGPVPPPFGNSVDQDGSSQVRPLQTRLQTHTSHAGND